MARNIQQSLSDLGHDIASFRQSTSQFNRAAGSIAMLFRSRAFKSAAKTVEIQQKFDAAVKLRNRARDIIEAKDAMTAHPNRWASASDYLKERDELKEARERVAKRKRDQESAFTKWSNEEYGSIPKGLRDAIDKFGGQDGNIAFERNFENAYNAEFNPEQFKYDQDVKTWGKQKADILRSERVNRGYMDNISRRAPWMKSLIESGKIDKKYLPAISKGIDKISAIPGVGNLMGLTLPQLAFKGMSAAALYATSLGVGAKEIVKSRNASKMFGDPGNNFISSMLSAGFSQDEAVNAYHKLRYKFGPDMKASEEIAKMLHSLDYDTRHRTATGLGLDAADVQGLFYLHGLEKRDIYSERARKGSIEDEYIKYKWRSGEWIDSTLWFLNKPFTREAQREVMLNELEGVRRGIDLNKKDFLFFEVMDEVNNEASRTDPNLTSTTSQDITYGGDTVIANVTINGDADKDDVVRGTVEGVSRAIAQKRKVNLDYVGTGVRA